MERAVFIDGGASWGLQIGGQSTDLVLIAVNEHGFQDLLRTSSKSAGTRPRRPGRWTEYAGLHRLEDECGASHLLAQQGSVCRNQPGWTVVSQNTEDTEIYFGHPHSFEAILKGTVAVPDGSVDL